MQHQDNYSISMQIVYYAKLYANSLWDIKFENFYVLLIKTFERISERTWIIFGSFFFFKYRAFL